MDGASDLMLLEREICFSVPPSRATWSALDTSPPSAATAVQASATTAQDAPTNSDNIVPASPASSKERLDCFLNAIQKKLDSTFSRPQPVQRHSRIRAPRAQQLKTHQQQAS
jgi:hypothetical protein